MKKYILFTAFAVMLSFVGGASTIYAQTVPAPTITSVEHTPATYTSTETWTVFGKNFTQGSKLEYTDTKTTIENTGELNYVLSFSPTEIKFRGDVATGNIASVYSVKIVGPQGKTSNSVIVNTIPTTSAPTITGVSSESVKVGGLVTVYGSGIDAATEVQIMGEKFWTQPVSHTSTSLTFRVPTNLIPGSYNFALNEKGSDSTSNIATFTIAKSQTAPLSTSLVITRIGSSNIKAGGLVTVYGSGFSADTEAKSTNGEYWATNPITHTSTTLTFRIPADISMGSHNFVLTKNGNNTTSNVAVFTVTPSTSLVIRSTSPGSVRAGGLIIVYGLGFDSGTEIINSGGHSWGVKPTRYTSNRLTFRVPTNLIPGSYNFALYEDGALSNTATFNVTQSLSTTGSAQIKNTSAETAGDTNFYAPRAGTMFARNMWRGMHGNDVKKLQKLFNSTQEFKLAQSGPGSPGNETTYFGFLLKAAVQNFQCKYGIVCSGTANSTGYGVVGPQTRAKLSSVFKNISTKATKTAIQKTTAEVTTSNHSPQKASVTTAAALQQKIQQMLKQLKAIQQQLRVLQGAMARSALGR